MECVYLFLTRDLHKTGSTKEGLNIIKISRFRFMVNGNLAWEQYIIQWPNTRSDLNPQNFSLKNFLYFSLKKPALKKFLITSQKKLFLFSGNGTFLYFRKGIFRTLAYLQLEAYSEPWYIQNSRHIQNTVKYLQSKVL